MMPSKAVPAEAPSLNASISWCNLAALEPREGHLHPHAAGHVGLVLQGAALHGPRVIGLPGMIVDPGLPPALRLRVVDVEALAGLAVARRPLLEQRAAIQYLRHPALAERCAARGGHHPVAQPEVEGAELRLVAGIAERLGAREQLCKGRRALERRQVFVILQELRGREAALDGLLQELHRLLGVAQPRLGAGVVVHRARRTRAQLPRLLVERDGLLELSGLVEFQRLRVEVHPGLRGRRQQQGEQDRHSSLGGSPSDDSTRRSALRSRTGRRLPSRAARRRRRAR